MVFKSNRKRLGGVVHPSNPSIQEAETEARKRREKKGREGKREKKLREEKGKEKRKK